MAPITTQTLLANTLAYPGGLEAGLPAGGAAWDVTQVSAADQASFEMALQASGTQSGSFASHTVSHSGASSSTSIGDSIIDSLASVKRRGEEMKLEMATALSDTNLSSGKMIAMQYKLMHMSIELQTTSNMAHHGVEDVKTIMRGQ